MRHVVLAARQPCLDAGQTLADLYNLLTMPGSLLDAGGGSLLSQGAFENDRQRVEYLFALYQKLTAPLIPAVKASKARRKT